jgi:hypothetical protein
MLAVFLACFWLPVGSGRFDGAMLEALHLVKWYAREHVAWSRLSSSPARLGCS